jgi:glycosyltransferase involved in cell wall biosynthesis
MENKKIKYVIITPARNEDKYIYHTYLSVSKQTIKPIMWVIVDDGSTDNTGRMIDAWVKEHDWIYPLHRLDRGFRQAGVGVIDTFYAGFELVKDKKWDFIVKLDADLSFDANFFENCFEHFENNPQLGICGGGIYHQTEGKLQIEKQPAFHVRGATKIIRRACWLAIDGFEKITGWDTLDEAKANMHGWRTRTFNNLVVIHYRHTGAADGSWKDAIKKGRANYICGYHPLFMFLKFLKRLFSRPFLIDAVGLLYGYLGSYFSKIPQTSDKDVIKYIQQQQINLLFGKKTIWK